VCCIIGAYRRWKDVTIDASSTDTKKSKKGGSTAGNGKKKPKNTADKFYDAIKKLGSGPAEKVPNFPNDVAYSE
jgi:hypothetical protein